VIIAALRWGAIPAVFAGLSGIAAVAYFFYAPFFDLRVQSPAQIADIVLFVTVAAITGRVAVAARKAKIRAQAESLRDALIGSVSHGLRTPLAAITGSASILAQSSAIAKDEHLSSLVQVVREEADRLNGDIQNLLDATRITSEGLRPQWAWVDPEDLINGALSSKRRMLAERPVNIDITDNLPLAYIDASLIRSALGQVIENAAKYSPPGSPIGIRAEQTGGMIRIDVSDKGAGVAYSELEKMFERFYRGSAHATNTPGSGLGLWIARSLIEACGGHIGALIPDHGIGTILRIELPVKTQPDSDESADE
jgi:two-component system sensor histidine kinase KdpD